MVMDFQILKQTADIWCQSNGYTLLLADEEERRIVFKNKQKEDVTFFVVCPEKGKKSWHVWTENEDILCYLAQTQDALGSCKERSLTEVLNIVHKDLSPMQGGAVSAERPSSDTDDEIDSCGDADEDEDDDFDNDPGYYQEDDVDALTDEATNAVVVEEPESADDFFTGDGSSSAVHRLLADMKNFKKSEGRFGVSGGPRGDNLFIWDVKLHIPNESLLGSDLQRYAKANKREPVVYLEMKFPKDYPMVPPFVRVLRPRFKFLTGHVTIGGSVCMEMLSRSGWRPTNDIESILVQIRAEIMSDDKARLDTNADTEYDEVEARHAFERMVKRYGWDK